MEEKQFSERVARLRLLIPDQQLRQLQNSTVMVIGLGGVGSSCAEALARGGVGKLIFLDRDVVEESNINRQAIAFTSTLGQEKVEVMRRMVEEINPDCQVDTKKVFLIKETVAKELASFPRPDYVIDCIDTISQKLAIMNWCIDQSIPLIASMGAANKLDPCYLKFDYIEKTKNCHMSKVIRRECRRRGIRKLEVLYSEELPLKLDREQSQIKAETLGSMSYMPPIMGQMLAGKVIRRLAGLETYRTTPIRKGVAKE